MTTTLFELACTTVRRNWHLYEDSTRFFVFDLIWQDRVAKLGHVDADILQNVRDFCADSTRDEYNVHSLSRYQRALLHKACEDLGLNHKSCGSTKARVLMIAKLSDWAWEFTNRPPQLGRPPRDLEKEKRAVDYEDVVFQVYCKYRGYGYNSPGQMLANEPEFRQLIENGKREFDCVAKTHYY